jgi:hypothetical protein
MVVVLPRVSVTIRVILVVPFLFQNIVLPWKFMEPDVDAPSANMAVAKF